DRRQLRADARRGDGRRRRREDRRAGQPAGQPGPARERDVRPQPPELHHPGPERRRARHRLGGRGVRGLGTGSRRRNRARADLEGHRRGARLMIDGFIALYIFMLAAFTGYEVIARVPVILHTPLMSGSNFVHGIVLVGAMVALGRADTTLETVIGFIGVVLAAGNAVGGYVVTERMLEMFKSSKEKR